MSPTEKFRAALFGVSLPRPENRRTPRDFGLDYQTITLPFGERERIVAWSIGHPQPRGVVALFPAYATSKESLLQSARALHDLGYHTLLVDFRGVGDASGARTTLGIREAEDVALVADYARRTWPNEPLILYGVSMGSAAIMRAMAVEGVRAEGLIVESPFDRFSNTVGNRFRAFGVPAEPATVLLVFWGGIQVGANGFAHNPVEYAASIRCPTLILHGAQDPRVTVAQVTALRDGFSPPPTLVLVPGAGHGSLIAFAPSAWRTSVADFLPRVPGTP